MSVEAPSDEILSQETLTRRNNVEPRYLSIRRDGRITLPTGTILDALRSTVLFNGNLLDNVPDGNIIQGQASDGNSVTGTVSSSRLLSSRDSIIADSQHAQVSTSRNASVSRSDYSSIENSATCEIYSTSPIPVNLYCKILNSQQSYIRGDSGGVFQSSIKDSFASEIRNNADGTVTYSSIDNCLLCQILNNRTTTVPRMKIIASSDSVVDSCAESVILSSKNTDITTTLTDFRNAALVCRNALLQDCSECIAYGFNTTGISIDRTILFGTTGVTDGEFRAGLDFHVDGLGNNITTNDGYVQTERGLVQNYREITATGDLLPTDGTVLLNSVSPIFLNFPSAASIGTNYPLGTVREFTFIGLQANEPSYLQLVGGGNTFNNKSSWTRHRLNRGGERVKVQLINSLSPYWSFDRTIIYTSRISSTVADNFGVAPPQVDASILPTSTGQLNHQALGSGSYYTLGTMLNDNPQTFSLLTPGFRISTPGRYTITYYITVDFSGDVAGHYVLRTDLLDVNTSSTISNSYLQTTGLNSRGGSRVIISSPIRTTISVSPFDVQLRISQDSVNTISSNASITSVIVEVVGNI